MLNFDAWKKAGRGPALGSLSTGLALLLVLSLWLAAGRTARAAEETYVVQRGDNLTAIAARFNLTVQSLAVANGIVNANNIYAGQVLKLPRGAASSSTPAAVSTGHRAYIVQRGDTLSSLSKRFSLPVSDLAKLNRLSVMDYLYIGQALQIPDSAPGWRDAGRVRAETGEALENATTAAATTVVSTATSALTPPPPTGTPSATTTTPVPISTTPAASTSAASSTATGSSVTTATASAAPATAPPPTPTATAYTVKRGDTLSGIAASYGVSLEALRRANNMPASNFLRVGQQLIIPAPGSPNSATAAAPPAGKWIDVNLTTQRLVAYEGMTEVFTTLVSTGTARTPTVTGTFNIYLKYTSQAMTGGSGRDYYYLPGVPSVMYFYGSYAIHGAYWHNNFGTPMSHGCVNLPVEAAKFMYNWAPMGTPVKIHF